MELQKRVMERCIVCLQPTTNEFEFDLSYQENGKKVSKKFCGGSCLKRWVETELDKTHLDELESPE